MIYIYPMLLYSLWQSQMIFHISPLKHYNTLGESKLVKTVELGQEYLIKLNRNKIITKLLSKQVNKYKNKVCRHSTVTNLPLLAVLIVLPTSVTFHCFKFTCKSVNIFLTPSKPTAKFHTDLSKARISFSYMQQE